MSEHEGARSDVTCGVRRRDKRLLINAQVEITGVDHAGNPFTERTKVEDFSDVGCRFWTRNLLRRGGTVAIKPLGQDGEGMPQELTKLFEIMWAVRRTTGWTVGVRALQSENSVNRGSSPANHSPEEATKCPT